MRLILTTQMVRDHLTHKGPKSLTELVETMDLVPDQQNTVMTHLLILDERHDVHYDASTGKWVSDVVIERRDA